MDTTAVAYCAVKFKNSNKLYTYAMNSYTRSKFNSLLTEFRNRGVVALVADSNRDMVAVTIVDMVKKPDFRCRLLIDISIPATKYLNRSL